MTAHSVIWGDTLLLQLVYNDTTNTSIYQFRVSVNTTIVLFQSEMVSTVWKEVWVKFLHVLHFSELVWYCREIRTRCGLDLNTHFPHEHQSSNTRTHKPLVEGLPRLYQTSISPLSVRTSMMLWPRKSSDSLFKRCFTRDFMSSSSSQTRTLMRSEELWHSLEENAYLHNLC